MQFLILHYVCASLVFMCKVLKMQAVEKKKLYCSIGQSVVY